MAAVRKEVDAATLVERGKAFAGVGDPTRAEEYLAAALDAGADPRDVLPLLIDVCVKTGRYRSAIQHGENHLRKHPSDLHTRVMVGALYAAIGDGRQARAQLEKVVGPPPDELDVEPAPTQADRGEETEALADGGAAAVVEPRAPEPHVAPASSEPDVPALLRAQAHYVLAVVARDTDNDVVAADRHFRAYLRIEPNGSHAEEAKASLLKRVP